MDHVKLLCNFSEISWLFSDSTDIKAFLHKIVTMVGDHMRADVCSIYLYDEEEQALVFRATKGLNPEAVDTLKAIPRRRAHRSGTQRPSPGL